MSGMSGPITLNNSLEKVMEWKKNYYFRLESESSIASEEGTESIDSIQDKETDIVDDSSEEDTDILSDCSDLEVEVEYEMRRLSEGGELEVEYEIRSASEGDDYLDAISSSGTEMILEAAETAIAAVLCDSSLEAWATDGETSSNSSSDEVEFGVTNNQHGTCIQCKSLNTNPGFRYCNKCFQKCWKCSAEKDYNGFPLCHSCFKVKKTFFPPRPRGNRKRKLEKEQNKPKVKLDTLQSCLSGLRNCSQDSGLGSSQDLPELDFKKIIVPEHLKRRHAISEGDSDIFDEPPTKSRKTVEDESISKNHSPSNSQNLEDNQSVQSNVPVDEQPSNQKLSEDILDTTKRRKTEDESISKDISDHSPSNSQNLEDNQSVQSNVPVDEQPSNQKLPVDILDGPHNKISNELCMMCNSRPKNGIFLHGSIGHTCCCYKCAMKAWKTSKRCPICNCKVKNVIKLYTL